MIPLIRLKKDVEFNSELKFVMDALKGIAMNRYLSLQKKLTTFDRFPELAGELLSGIAMDQVDHPFVKITNNRAVVLMITTDSGFVGSVNSQVLSAGLAAGGPDAKLAVIGDRGAASLADLKKPCQKFPGIDDKTRTQLAAKVREAMVQHILDGECGRFLIVYPKPISMSFQKATVETLLPCAEWLADKGNAPENEEIIWESEPRDVLSYIATYWVEHRLDEIFAMSRVAELGARVMHLEGSYQEVVRQGKQIKLQYHRARHEVIDRSMREVFASQLLFGRLAEEEAGGA